jgi:nitroimidazol reductase NimA-like FMN-containing flavoprotein (pyridoxamine 5'-phosphate oxidase superfamily)
MRKLSIVLISIFILSLFVNTVYAQKTEWEKGGPKYLYVKPTKKPPHHGIYDEDMKCLDCHKYDGVDAYTSATMTVKKTKKGRAPRAEIEEAIRETLKGVGDFREIFILSTSFDDKPLSTVIEFVMDPKTFTFYAMSEKQTEKLFHIAKNPNVSLGYVKQRESYNYFEEALGVQIVGKAQQIKGSDPEFDEAAAIYIPTLPLPKPLGAIPQPPGVELLTEMIRPAKIITKIVPERMVILDRKFKEKGLHAIQIWEAEIN